METAEIGVFFQGKTEIGEAHRLYLKPLEAGVILMKRESERARSRNPPERSTAPLRTPNGNESEECSTGKTANLKAAAAAAADGRGRKRNPPCAKGSRWSRQADGTAEVD